VIIVGAGNAALTAALAAHQQGAKVLVLESSPKELRGGNSRFSGGIFRFAHSGMDHVAPLLVDEARHWTDKVELDGYEPDRFRGDLDLVCESRSDRDLLNQLIGRSYDTVAWMQKLGVRWELVVDKLFDPSKFDPNETYILPAGGAVRAVNEGVGLMYDLFEAAEKAGIEIRYDSPAQELLMDGSTCVGVKVRHLSGFEDIRGSVVLASGGFESNPAMRLQYLGTGWDLVKVRGTRFNMGTMLVQALGAGAAPAGHWGGAHASPLDASAPTTGELSLTDRLSRYSYPYSLLVNRRGERFVDEGEDEVWLTYAKTGWAIREQPSAAGYQIFDQKTIDLLEPRYATGTPVEASSLTDLAQKLGISAEGLERTVRQFNDATREGKFLPFEKDGLSARPEGQPPKSNWAQPLDKPPYVCYPVVCGITFTYGGLHIDAQSRVLDTEGRVMPNLYATGEIAGGFFFHNYAAGSGLMRGAVFGKLSGEQAVADLRS